MPESREEPDDKQIQNDPAGLYPGSAQGEIHIIPKPGGKRYMPSAPELRECVGYVREIEVFQKTEAQHASQADRHIRIAVKVKIQLEAVAECPHPRHANRVVSGCERHVCDLGEHIGKKDFLIESKKESHDSLFKAFRSDLTLVDLIHHGGIANDRAGNQLRKKRNIESEIRRVFLRVDASVYIDHITHRLKSEERNADGKRDRGLRKPCPADRQPGMNVRCEKVQILENNQNSQVQYHIQRQNGPGSLSVFSVSLDSQRQQVVEADGRHHYKDELRFTPGIEEQAGQQKPVVAQFSGQQEVHPVGYRQKQKQKFNTGKKHGWSISSFEIQIRFLSEIYSELHQKRIHCQPGTVNSLLLIVS